MSRDADLRDDIVARLWRVRERLGPEAYRAAGRAALHAIAASCSKRRRGAPVWIGLRA